MEDIFHAEHEIIKLAFGEQSIKNAKRCAKRCKSNPMPESWKPYLSELKTQLDDKMKTQSALAQYGTYRLSSYAHVTPQEFRKSFERNYIPPKAPDFDSECKKIIFEAAVEIFEHTKVVFQRNDDCSQMMALELSSQVLGAVMLAKTMISYCTNGEASAADIPMLKKHAEVLDWLLEAVVHYEGKSISIYLGDYERRATIGELQNIYVKIRRLDPSFIVPSLPNAAPVKPVQPAQTSSDGCYVATAVYGSYDCPQVWTLRRFRDNTLAETWYGRLFIHTYYAISPTLVKWFGKTKWFKNLCKPKLDRLVMRLNDSGVENTPYNDRNW